MNQSFEFYISHDVENHVGPDSGLYPILEHWRSMGEGGGQPPAGDIELSALDAVVGNVMWLEVIDGGLDFRYRHYGSAIAEVFGRDMTGSLLSSLEAIPVMHFMKVYRDVVETGRPCYTLHRVQTTLTSGATDVCWERLILPLFGDGGEVAQILAGNFRQDWNHRANLYGTDDSDAG